MLKLPAKTNGLFLSIFRKATFSGVFNYVYFDTYNIGLVHTLLFRFFKNLFQYGKFSYRIRLLRSIFKCNNHPVHIIDQCIKMYLDILYVPKQIVPTVPKRELLVVLLLLGNIFFEFEKTFV